MSCDGIFLIERHLRPRVIIVPAALITKAKAAAQNIRTAFCVIKNAEGGSIVAIGRHRVLPFGGIEIKIRFHTAGEHVQVSFAACPKRLDQALPPLRGCLNKGAAPTRNCRTGIGSKTVTCKLIDPRRFAPFNPHALGGHVEQICAFQRARAFRVRQRAAKSHQIIAQAISYRAGPYGVSEISRSDQASLPLVLGIFHDERRSTLCNSIGQSHGGRQLHSASRKNKFWDEALHGGEQLHDLRCGPALEHYAPGVVVKKVIRDTSLEIRSASGSSRAHVTNLVASPCHGVLCPKNHRIADGCVIVSRMSGDVHLGGSVKARLAVHVTLLMLFGCAAKPPAPAPNNAMSAANPTPAATAPARSASANASTGNANPAVDQTLVQRGYQPRRFNGQLKYCRSQVLTGTHFRSTVCLTPEEISATDGNTKSDLNQLDRAGRSICPNNKCGVDQ